MNLVLRAMPLRLASLIALGLLLLVGSGCLGPKVNWPERVGVLTFDQAVLEMGPPDKQAKLTDGTLVAEWVTLRSETYRRGLHTNPGVGSGNWFPHYHETDTPEYSLRLIFAPDGRLKEWKDVIR